MPINPFEVQQQAHWAGRQQSATQGATGGQLGRGVYAPTGGYHPVSGAQGPQFSPVNALGRANYKQSPVNNGGQQQVAGGNSGKGRKGAFGKGGNGAGITIQTQYGEGAFSTASTWGQGNTGGVGNISGNNNTVSGNMGIGNFQGMPTTPAAAEPAPAPAPAGPAPTGGKPAGPKLGKTPKALPSPSAGPTPALPAGGKPVPALGAGPATTPTAGGPTTPPALGPGTTATTPKPSREDRIRAIANDPNDTGERATARRILGMEPSGAKTAGPERPSISGPKPGQQQPTTDFDKSEKVDYDVPNYGTDDNYSGTNDAPQPTAPAQQSGSNVNQQVPRSDSAGNVVDLTRFTKPPEKKNRNAPAQAPAAQAEEAKQRATKKVGSAVKKGPQPVKNAQLKAKPRAKKKEKRS